MASTSRANVSTHIYEEPEFDSEAFEMLTEETFDEIVWISKSPASSAAWLEERD